jgi:aminoglycoside phosphotransferase (APT) family kinase protein
VASGNGLHADVRAVLDAAAGRIGVPADDARLIRLHSNASFALPRAGLLVRIATNPAAYDRVAASVAVTRWLAARGYPCTAPADITGQPFLINGHAVSIWRLAGVVPGPQRPGAALGRLLRELHDQPDPPRLPHRFTDPFYSVAAAVGQAAPGALPGEDLDWLRSRIAGLRAEWKALRFDRPPGLIHGDAHVSNLIQTSTGQVILGDWDHVAIGPPEWDLMQIHFMKRRFGRASDEDISEFTRAYGWDIRAWPGLETLIAAREITGLSAHIRTAPAKPATRAQLIYRLGTLRRGDHFAPWESPPG